jgi:primosomal protein N' (replication factor Y)
VIWRLDTPPPPRQALEVAEILKGPHLYPEILPFLEWMAGYYHTPLGEVLRTVLPAARKRPPKAGESRRYLEENGTDGLAEIPLTLTPEQEILWQAMEPALRKKAFAPFLIYGITGSGKTELYLRAAEAVLNRGEGVLYLIPEIALVVSLTQILSRRFPGQVALWHSALSGGERKTAWEAVLNGERKIVLGTRSALFAPLSPLGLIIVDEEHDPSYKQEDYFPYHARDMALVRGKLAQAAVLLGSATPSLETFFAGSQGKNTRLTLKERVGGSLLPGVELVDLRENKGKLPGLMTPYLISAVEDCLASGGQALLFLNRRGYAPSLICPTCGFIFRCPHCQVSLTLHQRARSLCCHYCGEITPVSDQCPQCYGQGLLPLGAGTEKVEEVLSQIFPKVGVGRLDRDTTRKRGAHQAILTAYARQETGVLVGTQMVTKGHHFPQVTLVGVLLADQTLNLPDFRACERTFQLLTQVAGRAGRGREAGKVIIQTYSPDHYVLQFAKDQDYEGFYAREIAWRKKFGYPPFTRMARFRFQDREEKVVAELAKTAQGQIKEVLKKSGLEGRIRVLGPAPCPFPKIREQYRWQLIFLASQARVLQEALGAVLPALRKSLPQKGKGLRLDVDPQELL